ncbi:hypothetical protein [Shinella sp.]|uniref:hypothetical protein n=1 Tax=Shinella sp. TaxID=1870904 RepID=UPI00301C018E
MHSKPTKPSLPPHTAEENIAYTRQMLGELRAVADNEGAEMLRYFIEMAYVEAGDILAGLRPLSLRGRRDPATGMPLKPAGKVKF